MGAWALVNFLFATVVGNDQLKIMGYYTKILVRIISHEWQIKVGLNEY